jgi:hypothetical protein
MTPGEISGWIGLASAIIGILYLVFGPIADLRERVRAVETRCETQHTTDRDDDNRLRDLAVDMAVVKEDVGWLTKSMEQRWADKLHSPTHHRRDNLVQKMVDQEITAGELEELLVLLEDAVATERSADKRWIAGTLHKRATVLLDRLERTGELNPHPITIEGADEWRPPSSTR